MDIHFICDSLTFPIVAYFEATYAAELFACFCFRRVLCDSHRKTGFTGPLLFSIDFLPSKLGTNFFISFKYYFLLFSTLMFTNIYLNINTFLMYITSLRMFSKMKYLYINYVEIYFEWPKMDKMGKLSLFGQRLQYKWFLSKFYLIFIMVSILR